MKKAIRYSHYGLLKKIIFVFLMVFTSLVLFSQNYPNIVNHHISSTPIHGVKIKTNIPFSHGMGIPTVKIEGYDYNLSNPLNISLVWYVFNDNFHNAAVSGYGGAIPDVWLSNEDGKIVIFLDERIYFQRFTVSAFAQGKSEKPEYFEGWTVVDEPLGGINQKNVPYKNNFGGNVGIGTTSPRAGLHVTTSNVISGESVAAILGNTGSQWTYFGGTTGGRIRGSNDGYLVLESNPTGSGDKRLLLNLTSPGNVSIAAGGGNVGIGTGHPQSKLDVAGTIRAREVKVELTAGADFVFEPEYNLMPLSEVQSFIQTNKHLPGIQSEEEMIENGLNMNEFQIKLLQKIEELTLYIIEQQNEINDLKQKLTISRE